MEYPEYVLEKLNREYERLDICFSSIWALMSPSQERDEIMYHILQAKVKINKLLPDKKEELK